MISANQLNKKYGDLPILKNVSLQINKGEVAVIVGPSGAGKSTLLHLLGTLDRPDSGTITINNQDINKFNDKELSYFRNTQIGFVFQFHHLLNEFTAFENICLPGYLNNSNTKQIHERAHFLMQYLNIENRAEHKPMQMSGGEQQRVAVARALINNPSVIFADEPSGNLDSKNAIDLHNLFFKMAQEFKQTFVIVTHNQELANNAHQLLHMKDGCIV